MTHEDILNFINFVADKEQTGNTINPQEYNRIAKVKQLRFFKKLIGLPEEYQVGMEMPRIQPELTQKITDSLSTFKTIMGDGVTSPLIINTNGRANIPTDYYYHSSLKYIDVSNAANCTPQKLPRTVRVLTDTEFDAIEGRVITAPTIKYPVCNYQSGFIRFLPKTLKKVDYIYYRYPLTPVYDYYINADGENIYLSEGEQHTLTAGEEGSAGQTYSPTSTTTVTSLTQEFEFNDIDKIDIAILILSDIAQNLSDDRLQAYAQNAKNSGV